MKIGPSRSLNFRISRMESLYTSMQCLSIVLTQVCSTTKQHGALHSCFCAQKMTTTHFMLCVTFLPRPGSIGNDLSFSLVFVLKIWCERLSVAVIQLRLSRFIATLCSYMLSDRCQTFSPNQAQQLAGRAIRALSGEIFP